MRIPGLGLFGPPTDQPGMLALLRRAVELNVNFIDTADMYDPFVSEKLLAEALHPYPAGLVVGTKGRCFRFGPGPEGVLRNGTPQHLHYALHGSLCRLQLERIDLYQLHRLDPRVPPERTFAFLAEAQRQELVRHLGLSGIIGGRYSKGSVAFSGGSSSESLQPLRSGARTRASLPPRAGYCLCSVVSLNGDRFRGWQSWSK